MKREGALRIAVLLTMFAMMTSWLPVYDMKADLVENQERREQLGPGEPTIEERCSVLTFEDTGRRRYNCNTNLLFQELLHYQNVPQ